MLCFQRLTFASLTPASLPSCRLPSCALARLRVCLPACSLAISQAIVIGGCTPTVNQVLARAEALAIAQGNGGKFKSVAKATSLAQCLP